MKCAAELIEQNRFRQLKKIIDYISNTDCKDLVSSSCMGRREYNLNFGELSQEEIEHAVNLGYSFKLDTRTINNIVIPISLKMTW